MEIALLFTGKGKAWKSEYLRWVIDALKEDAFNQRIADLFLEHIWEMRADKLAVLSRSADIFTNFPYKPEQLGIIICACQPCRKDYRGWTVFSQSALFLIEETLKNFSAKRPCLNAGSKVNLFFGRHIKESKCSFLECGPKTMTI